MKLVRLATLVTCLVPAFAAAFDQMEGTWTVENMACSSGKTAELFEPSHFSEHKLDFQLKFQNGTLVWQVNTIAKSTPAHAVKKIEDAEKSLRQLTRDHKSTVEIKEELAVARAHATGVNCSHRIEQTYTLAGTMIDFNQVSKYETTCPWGLGDASSFVNSFTIGERTEDMIKLTDVDAVDEDGEPCPKGDRMILTLMRVK